MASKLKIKCGKSFVLMDINFDYKLALFISKSAALRNKMNFHKKSFLTTLICDFLFVWTFWHFIYRYIVMECHSILNQRQQKWFPQWESREKRRKFVVNIEKDGKSEAHIKKSFKHMKKKFYHKIFIFRFFSFHFHFCIFQ